MTICICLSICVCASICICHSPPHPPWPPPWLGLAASWPALTTCCPAEAHKYQGLPLKYSDKYTSLQIHRSKRCHGWNTVEYSGLKLMPGQVTWLYYYSSFKYLILHVTMPWHGSLCHDMTSWVKTPRTIGRLVWKIHRMFGIVGTLAWRTVLISVHDHLQSKDLLQDLQENDESDESDVDSYLCLPVDLVLLLLLRLQVPTLYLWLQQFNVSQLLPEQKVVDVEEAKLLEVSQFLCRVHCLWLTGFRGGRLWRYDVKSVSWNVCITCFGRFGDGDLRHGGLKRHSIRGGGRRGGFARAFLLFLRFNGRNKGGGVRAQAWKRRAFLHLKFRTKPNQIGEVER